MKIVIAGAGDVGFHLAELLAYEDQDIILIDKEQEVLDYAASHLDVLTIRGDSSSFNILKQAEVQHAQLVLAVTTSEKNNLLTATLDKRMGAKRTIARVDSSEYICDHHEATFQELGVDTIISPVQLAASEIQRLMEQHILTDIFEFEDGKIDVIGFTVDNYSLLVNQTIQEIDLLHPDVIFKPIAILRGHKTIIPKADTVLRRNDHLYFITHKEEIDQVVNIFGKKKRKIENVMIIGGSNISFEKARVIENAYQLTVIEQKKDKYKHHDELFNNT